ncbi:unnamed protein product [Orchesella dallaii]|uniref:C-type lectin domain-containing protein n=1 Tax=Orchesella dallaii TaxID=48710 RepID=A0ABP1QRB8_9HEXA
MFRKPLDLGFGKRIYFGAFEIALLIIFHSRPLIVSASNALIDAPIAAGGEIPVEMLENWIIVRKSMTWGDAAMYCNEKYFRLTVLPALDNAKGLIDKIKTLSKPYDPGYDKLYKEVEFGMDRRYWIGLTDLMEEGKWTWIQDGTELAYELWYPKQPDHKMADGATKSLEHCVSLWNPGYNNKDSHSFNDEDCKNKYYPICDAADGASAAAAAAVYSNSVLLPVAAG